MDQAAHWKANRTAPSACVNLDFSPAYNNHIKRFSGRIVTATTNLNFQVRHIQNFVTYSTEGVVMELQTMQES